MHCGYCGNTRVEVRPCYISRDDKNAKEMFGDIYLCATCAYSLAPLSPTSDFITWLGFPCDQCSKQASFDQPIAGLPLGIVCDDCNPRGATDWWSGQTRGMWLCEDCFDADHHGHKQKEIVPILERLARITSPTGEDEE